MFSEGSKYCPLSLWIRKFHFHFCFTFQLNHRAYTDFDDNGKSVTNNWKWPLIKTVSNQGSTSHLVCWPARIWSEVFSNRPVSFDPWITNINVPSWTDFTHFLWEALKILCNPICTIRIYCSISLNWNRKKCLKAK